MTTHHLDPTPATLIDVFDRSVPPVLRIEPGDTVIAHSLDAWGFLRPQTVPGEQQPMAFPARRGHALLGPIAVTDAQPGRTLAVHLETLRPDAWGWTRAGGQDNVLNRMLGTAGDEPADLLWQLDPDAGVGTNQLGVEVTLAPFLGVTGLAPDAPGEHSTVPPRDGVGGNIDCRDLVAGSTLFLPVAVPDALLFVGDGHAAQGDGEVCGTAVECGMSTQLRVTLHDDVPVGGVHAVTPTHRITFGFDADLNRASGVALAAMLDWMQQLFDVRRNDALALASVLVDLRVTQVANGTWGVHARLGTSHPHGGQAVGHE